MVIETAKGTGISEEADSQIPEINPAQGQEREEILRSQKALLDSGKILKGPDYYQFVDNMFRLLGGTSSSTRSVSNPLPAEDGVTFRFVLDHSDGNPSVWSKSATIIESIPVVPGLTVIIDHHWSRNLGSPEGTKYLRPDNPHAFDSTVLDSYDSQNSDSKDLFLGHELIIPLNATRMCEKILKLFEENSKPSAS